jgi:methylated-DNA-[protein]-cysteine S-methyltransferase
MSMIEHFLMESPLGALTLVNTDGVSRGLYIPEHLRGSKAESLWPRTLSGFEREAQP